MSEMAAMQAGDVIGEFLVNESRRDNRIFIIVCDAKPPGSEQFREEFPDRFIDIGIAEQNAISIAAGLAMSGNVVYLWNCATFLLYRPFDQIRVDIAYGQTRVKLIGTCTGYSRSLSSIGHITVEDVAVMRALPNMTVACPGDLSEARALIKQCHDLQGPTYLRFPFERDELPLIHAVDTTIQLGHAAEVTSGDDAVLITTGHVLPEARRWVDQWAEEGVHVRLVSMPTIKPFDTEFVVSLAREGLPILTYEDHSIIGGLGSAVAEVIAETGCGVPFRRIGIPDRYTYVVGRAEYLKRHVGIPDAAALLPWIKKHADPCGALPTR